jgi:hypothetical protein
MKLMSDTMAAIGQLLNDFEIVSYLLSGLESEYDHFVTSVTTRVDPLSLEEIYGYLLASVDDIIITAFVPSAIGELLNQLKLEFVVKALRDINYFLGVEVLHLQSRLLLSQRRYILDVLKRTNMLEAKPISSPMSTSSPLSTFVGDTMEDPSLFRKTVGFFQYLSLTHPNLAFAVNRVC